MVTNRVTRAVRPAPRASAATLFILGPILGMAAILTACGETTAPPPAPEPAVPVRVVSVAPVSGVTLLDVAGTVRLKRETSLAFNTPGRIAAILVREGDKVQAGQLLARLDTTALGANQASATAEVVRAQADVKRAEDLFAKGWVTAPRVEQARATMVAAQARVRQGQPATVHIPALGAEMLQGQVSEVGARGDDGTGTFRIELKLPADKHLASGQIGTARLTLGPAEPGAPISVPATAVFAARADEGFVYVLEPVTRRVRRRQVALGTVSDAGVVVTAGLKPGDQVVTTGIDRLREGQVIEVAPNSVPAGRQAGK